MSNEGAQWVDGDTSSLGAKSSQAPASRSGAERKGFSGGERVSPKSTSSSGPAYLRALHSSRSRITRASVREAKVLPRVLGA